uniref:Uncharacterized protein n=1 Tax=Micrurus surinamensis TaxID=129470 RepID=A0A2D4PU71_MICSU
MKLSPITSFCVYIQCFSQSWSSCITLSQGCQTQVTSSWPRPSQPPEVRRNPDAALNEIKFDTPALTCYMVWFSILCQECFDYKKKLNQSANQTTDLSQLPQLRIDFPAKSEGCTGHFLYSLLQIALREYVGK